MDLSEFLDVFFEECFEGLDAMESGLVDLDAENADVEVINTIFRAAHSIKGGAATFDMNDLSEFTHIMETLLDEMRDGRRKVAKPAVNLLLSSVDGLRSMCDAIRRGHAVDEGWIETLKAELEAMLANTGDAHAAEAAQPERVATGSATNESAVTESAATSGGAAKATWTIQFTPAPGMFASGNDPQHLFRALEELGDLTVCCDSQHLPALKEMTPEGCYLRWMLTLVTSADETSIREVFAWVEDESRLEIRYEGLVPAAEGESLTVDESAQSDANPESPSPESPSHESAAPEAGERASGRPGDLAPPAATQVPSLPLDTSPSASPKAAPTSGNAEGNSIRVSTDKLDDLINLVGELVITQSILSSFADGTNPEDLDKLRDGLCALARNTRELQETAMQIRMLPISTSFNRFPRLVRDLSARLDKQVELVISGGATELDKTVLEKIGDPLVHLVRNSLDHGIERPEQRRAAGKPEMGRLQLNAFHQGGSIVVQVIDDGAGLNTQRIQQKAKERGLVTGDGELSEDEINNLIFRPGFSTVENVSDVSGRGVGMDVVRRNIQDMGGNVTVDSMEGKGSIFTIRLPLTLAILDGQLIRVGSEIYIISLVNIVESLQVKMAQVNVVAGKNEVYQLREEFVPIIRLHQVFNLTPNSEDLERGLLVVVESEGARAGLFVDELLGQQQIVIKSLETNFRHIDTLSGATILGDGTVALILDAPELVKREIQSRRSLRRPEAA